MAPEHPPELVIFDARFEADRLKGDLHYIEVPVSERLRVRWDTDRQPENFVSVGGGVAFVCAADRGTEVEVHVSHDASPDDLADLRYRWSEGLNCGIPWVMFVLVLPIGYTVAATEPRPARAKLFKERFALYWTLRGDDLGRTTVECKLARHQGDVAAKLVELNRLCSGQTPASTAPIQIEATQPHLAKAVFISYAHEDNENPDPSKRWLDRLIQFLQPLVQQDELTVRSDQDIELGEDWHSRIQKDLSGARAVVLLISPAFLASQYVRNSELPVLLRNAKERGVKIIPIIVRRSLFEESRFKYPDPRAGPQEFSLASIQASNSPTRPLSSMTEDEQDEVLLKVARALIHLVSGSFSTGSESESATPMNPQTSASGSLSSVSGSGGSSRSPRDYVDGIVRGVATRLDQTKPLTLPVLFGGLSELFDRNTFRYESVKQCQTQEWGSRLHAAMQTLELLRLYSAFVSEHAPTSAVRSYKKLMEEVNEYCQMMAVSLFEGVAEVTKLREAVGTSDFAVRLPKAKWFPDGADATTSEKVDGPRLRAIKQMEKLRRAHFAAARTFG